MMGGSYYLNSRLVSYCILCLFVASLSTYAQEEGFLSINCCADSNTSDPNTNITWITDESWYSSKEGCRKINHPVQNNTDSEKARHFLSNYGTKWCYNLTTMNGQDYLIRGTFIFRDVQRTIQRTFFDALVGVTTIDRVNSSNDHKEIEGIFKASDEYINFCLLRGKGDPYISKLELRPLSLDYLRTEPSRVLNVLHRVNLGSAGPTIRYPDDPYDRIWSSELILEQSGNFVNATTNFTIANSTTLMPPVKVLQTALTDPEHLEIVHNDLKDGYNYEIYLYFFELDNSVEAGQRVFDIYINNENKQQIDILDGGSSYRLVVLDFTTNGGFNLTMIKSSNISLFGPICNAYEILQVLPEIQGTAQKEVDVVVDVKNELLESNQNNEVLKSWSGDPCLPFPWHGLHCEFSNGSSVITKIDISSNQLQGPLPPSVTKLTHLKTLNMSNNGFTSTIPEFPTSSTLITMDLSHNNLMGMIPESLASLPYLTTMYFGCNHHFSRELPANFRASRIKTDKEACSEQGSRHSPKEIIIGTVVGGSVLVIVVVGIFFICFYMKKKMANGKFDSKGYPMTKNAVYSIPSMDEIVLKSISIQSFTLKSIEAAIQQYKTLIGEGGFGSVYRGTLTDGQEVAVKVRSATSTQGTREFDNELNLLSAIRHENLVPLLGYCCENEQQILVYPFMSNGSLQDRLYGEASKRKILDWPTRLSIALGAARGLTYLHTFSGRCVIHRDVKSSNILLDQSMCAKVADFGFSKYAPQEGDSGASLEVRGTAGYLDPEYYSTQQLSAKSDVFSFGVVLLELISGREPLNIRRPRNEWSLVEWAKPYIRNSRIDEIVDPGIKGGYHAEAMWRVVEVALACIEPFSAYRPCMVDIVRELEDALIIENNASEYMKSFDSFGGSNRFSIERPSIIIPPTPTPTEPSTIISQPSPPQPR